LIIQPHQKHLFEGCSEKVDLNVNTYSQNYK